MSKIFILFSLTLVYQTFGYPNDGWGQESQWGNGPGRPEQQWGGGRPEQQWGPGPNSWKPNPEPHCAMIPNNVETIAITPLVKTNLTRNTVYLCDHGSTYQQIAWDYTGPEQITCNGVTVFRGNLTWNVNATDRNGNRMEETVTLTNYTSIVTYNNGNSDSLECGTISSGRCAGDQWWGTIICQADDQTGCCKNGVRGARALVAKIEIIGRCASRCSLGICLDKYENPINNRGFAERALDNQ